LLGAGLLLAAAPCAHASVPAHEIAPRGAEQTDRPNPAAASLVLQVAAACGHSPETAARVESELAARIEQLRSRGTVVGDARSRALAIHEFIHAEILRGKYDPAASDVAMVLAGGSYNCASVSALFLTLAQAFEVEATAASVVGHVWCRVKTDAGPLDVETTCRDWFILEASRAHLTPAEHARQSQAWQDHRERISRARKLDQSAFLAVFHYNRGVGLLRKSQFAAAVAANLAALQLDWRCQPAYGNLWAALQGWSRQRAMHGAHAVAAAQ
jgi:hypothetical protein